MWSIQLLGGLAVRGPGQEVKRFRTQKAAALLAYLAFSAAPGRPTTSREALIDLFWPESDPEVGRHNLSNALSFLRHVLEPVGVPPGTVVVADRGSVRLNREAITVDVIEFELAAARADRPGVSDEERMLALRAGAQSYQGSLLPGFYEEWIPAQAARLDSLFVRTVTSLTPMLLSAGRGEEALPLIERAVAIESLSEEVTRLLMETLVAVGQPAQALRYYRQLRLRLLNELRATPSDSLLAYARSLQPHGAAPAAMPVVNAPAPHAEQEGRLNATAEPTHGSALRGWEFLLRSTTRFFDRTSETQRISTMLADPHARLITITGPGGTGKTRLAIEAAAGVIERNRSAALTQGLTSAVFVPLAAVTEGDRLFDAVLRALGVVPNPGLDTLDQLASVLEARHGPLVVLDNFEQLVGDGAMRVRALLGTSAAAKLLVTSRQRLHIEAEREVHLGPLPTSGSSHDPEELIGVPSIAMFVDRAQNALPGFHLTERNSEIVRQLCEHLEGIPLAIEMAAARSVLLSPASILDQVRSNRLGFLTTRLRDADSRQKTLRATLDWSYELLPEAAQRFFCSLATFRGGWTLDAAERVCDCSTEDTLAWLTLLRDSSLILVVDTDSDMRFTMLETIREYARERLAAERQVAAANAHLRYFLELAETAEPHLTGPEQAQWLRCLDLEHENLRAALEWCGRGNDGSETALRMAAALWRFWWVRGHWSTARTYLMELLRREGGEEGTAVRARALCGAGTLAHDQGAYASAAAAFEESLRICRKAGDRSGIAAGLNGLGNVAQELGDYAAARRYHMESLSIYRQLGRPSAIADSLSYLGDLEVLCGEYDLARRYWDEALTVREELNDRRGVGDALRGLARAAKRRGEYREARTLYERSAELYRELGDRSRLALSTHMLGVVAENEGDLAGARAIYEECLATFRDIGDRSQVAWTLHGMGYVALCQGDVAAARPLLADGLAKFRQMAHTIGILRSLDRFAGLDVAVGAMAQAARLLGAACAMREATGTRPSASEEREIGEDRDAARGALGDDAFSTAWEQGRAMTTEQAIDEALAGSAGGP